ncbi:unnamed protein product [Schistosoma curassoni]|nr:unnamed protein product [Schistosoma curassoni]CAH8670558.1 unnamed protein product [Schistosoma bovis]
MVIEHEGIMKKNPYKMNVPVNYDGAVVGLARRSTLFPFTTPLPGISTAAVQLEHLIGRNKKWTSAGWKLSCESGLVFRTHLQDKEYVYLNAAEFGELEVVRDLLDDIKLDVNCVDYMGRNALLLAMKNENLDLVELLVNRLDFYAVEDALLNAISQQKNHLVKLIVDHPQYIRMEKQCKSKVSGPSSGTNNRGKRSQFSSDISPLMLAAHINNHEIIQLLLDRGLKLEMPHDRACSCLECETIRAEDSLILEQQRLHTYQALSSSAYLALTTSDPVSTAFILRNELYQLASQEKQFKEEYSELAVKCMDFAISCVDLCRTSDELHCLLGGTINSKPHDRGNPLNTIKNAIQSHEKKFVAHPNCQHQMENLFYSLMFCIRDFEGLQRLQFVIIFLSLLPFLYIIYLFFPHFKMPLPQSLIYRDRSVTKYEVTEILRCPVTKFLGHMVSYLTFLILITVATFRLDRTAISDGEDNWEVRYTEILSYDFRTSHVVMTKIQIILLFWILGQLCMECKQVYHYGLRYFFRSYYNFMDWVSIALYLASYSLRIIVDFKVQASMRQYQDVLKVAQSILLNTTCSTSKFCSSTEQTTHQNYVNYRNKILIPESAYWLRGCRLWWAPDDPEYISDCLFALGNVLSFSRISYLMPAWELLGPLQISLARMVSDIIRFMALFTVMVIAFVVGLTNLYWYFANIIVSVDAQGQLIRYASGIPSFKSTGATFHTLYWALFGQSSTNVTTIDENLASMYPGHEYLAVDSSPYIVNSLGSILYAIYNACMIIILLNMLIAMMSKSFDEIQGDRLEEWKFARASLWLVYIDQEGVLPVPLNLLPSREAISSLLSRFCSIIQWKKPQIYTKHHCDLQKNENAIIFSQTTPTKHHSVNTQFNQNIRKTHTTTTVSTLLDTNSIHSNEWTSDGSESENETEKILNDYKLHTDTIRADVMRRYLFKLQKQKEEELKSGEFSVMNIHRQQIQKMMDHEVKRKQELNQDKLSRKESKTQGDEEIDETPPKSATEIGDENRLRGLRSLLMPPSIRKKLEAVASVNHSGNESEKREAAEAAARFYLLQTTRKAYDTNKLSGESFKSRQSYSNQPKDETFTARTERPIKGVHLRELYGVEQEMHDMSEALSSYSLSEATISELNELETY